MGLTDWDTITSIISNSVAALTAIVVAIVAIISLTTWRKQMTGQGRYEVVRKLLLLARRFHTAFGRSRTTVTFSTESKDRPRDENESPEKAQILDEECARRARLQPATDLLS